MADFKEVKLETLEDVPIAQDLPLPTNDQPLYSKTAQPGQSDPGIRQLSSNSSVEKMTAGDILKTANFITGVSGWQIDGAGNAEFNNVTVRGTIIATSGTIGGFTIGTDYVRDTANSFGLASTVTAGDDVRFWAGDTFANRSTAPFRVTEAGVVTATSGTVGGWALSSTVLRSGTTDANSNVLIDSSNSLIRLGPTSGSYITLDGANLRIRSSNYSSGAAGFTVEPTLVEAENIIARGTLRGATFKYDAVSAVGGQLMVANADVLASDMTALDASTLTVRGDTTFAVNDILLMRGVATSGIQEEWLRVTAVGSAPTYSVTRDLASIFSANSNPAWKAGTPVVKQGVSDGSSAYSGGWLRLFGEGTNAPYYSVYARNGVAYNAYTEACRLGNLNGVGSFVSDTYGIFIGNSSTGSYLTYDTSSGNLVVNDSILSNQDVYGDGSDGDVTISVNTTLSSDMFYNNLTINTGVALDTGGYRIFVKGTLTKNGTGTIVRNGNAGSNGTDATSTTTGNGTGGAGGSALADGSVKGALGGVAGRNGVNGVGVVSGSVNGTAGLTGTTGSNSAKSLSPYDGATGAAGGSGGSSGGGSGGATGAGGTAGTRTGTVYNKIHNALAAYLLYDFFPSGDNLKAAPQNGGAASGGSGGVSAAVNGSASGSTGGAGGGGGNGGIVVIFVRKIVNSGTISANGGVGGNAGATFTSVASGASSGAGGSGGSAGGMGGNGGIVIIVYSSLTNSGTIQAVGGAGGTGASAGAKAISGGGAANDGVAGANGSTGNDGLVVYIKV